MATTQTKRKTAPGGSAARKKSTGGKGPAKGGSKKKSPSAARAKPRTGSQARSRAAAAHDGHVRMHTVHADLPIPYLTPGDLTANAQVIGARLPTLPLPPPKRLAFYGGLGALAVVGALDWPVAAAIGAATAVVRGKGD